MTQPTEETLIICPKCSNVLDRFFIKRVEVDLCSECGGLWLDAGELVKLRLTVEEADIQELLKKMEGPRNVPPTSKRVKLPCPVCPGNLSFLNVEGVDLDMCTQCRGLWLDRGELEPALEALTNPDDGEKLDALLGVAPAPEADSSADASNPAATTKET